MITTLEQFQTRHPEAVTNNCSVDPLSLTSALTKTWASNHDFHGVTFVECGDFVETFAGDARKAVKALDLHCFVKDGLLCTGYPAHAFARLATNLLASGIVARKVDYAPNF